MSGRKPSPCWEHVKVTALLPDGRQRRECGFCGLKKESKQDQASAWAKHLCIDCPGADDEYADDEEPLEAGPAPVDSDDDDEEQEVLNLADSEDEGDGSS